MINHLETWESLTRLNGPVLVVMNGQRNDDVAAAQVLDALAIVAVPAQIHVIAPSSWQGWLEARRVAPERILLARDEHGSDVEINHFLLTSIAVRWIVPRGFYVLVGAVPHNLYNESVQDVFERQASLIVPRASLLAHTLPHRYVYRFDAAALVGRAARSEAVGAYRQRATALVTALHDAWTDQGRPTVVDAQVYDDVLAPLETHLGLSCLNFNEEDPWPDALAQALPSRAIQDSLAAALDLLHHRDEQLAAYAALVEERNEAVTYRDALLAQERERYTSTLDARLGRIAGRVSRVLKGA